MAGERWDVRNQTCCSLKQVPHMEQNYWHNHIKPSFLYLVFLYLCPSTYLHSLQILRIDLKLRTIVFFFIVFRCVCVISAGCSSAEQQLPHKQQYCGALGSGATSRAVQPQHHPRRLVPPESPEHHQPQHHHQRPGGRNQLLHQRKRLEPRERPRRWLHRLPDHT